MIAIVYKSHTLGLLRDLNGTSYLEVLNGLGSKGGISIHNGPVIVETSSDYRMATREDFDLFNVVYNSSYSVVDASFFSDEVIFSDFRLTCRLGTPANAIGVGEDFYFGSIDGVEVGNPFDTMEESIEELQQMILAIGKCSLSDILASQISALSDSIKRPNQSQERIAHLTDRKQMNADLLSKLICFELGI